MSTITYIVKVASAKFTIDDAIAPKLTFRDGDTYVLDQADSSNASHLLQFTTSVSGGGIVEYDTGVTKTGTAGQAGAKTTIVTSGSTTDTLYYYSYETGGETYGEEFSNTGYNTSTNNLLKPIVGAEATAEKWGPMINHNIDQIATTAQVTAELNFKAPLANPAFTGTPTGITASHILTGAIPAAVTGGSGLNAVSATNITTGTLPVGVTGGSGLEQYFVENPAATQNLSGTYSTERMYFNNSYTLTGNVTISATGYLVLSTISDEDVTIENDDSGTNRTITGEGTLEYRQPQHFGGAEWAEGGDVTSYVSGGNTYRVHTFLSSGVFIAQGALTVDYLVVAGGGAGGKESFSSGLGGGGGAGGFRTATGFTVTAQAYTITVGAGGVVYGSGGNEAGNQGGDGGNSIFFTITSTGGGGGGGGPVGAAADSAYGNPGGSGGGSAHVSSNVGAGNTPSTSPAQGFAGGSTVIGGSGGGGGASAVGGNGTSTTGGAGGAGTANSYRLGTGVSAVTYAGGGGGSTSANTGGGGGGIGGGGSGSQAGSAPGNGSANTGGGGGGITNVSSPPGSTGGSGIVIIRYTI